MMKTISEIFDDISLIGQTPNLILKTTLPDKIFDEVKGWVEPCRDVKNDEYAALLTHRNVGTDHNSYQTAVPRRLIDNSFFFGYICHFGEIFLDTANIGNSNSDRRVHLRNYPGHFDGYDCWVNFTYRGDDNPIHDHAGTLSSIIYIQDDDCQPTHFPAIGYDHYPRPGEILLFSSHLKHYVGVKHTESERITASLNLDVFNG